MEVGGVRICCQVLQNTYAGHMRIGELEQRGDLYANRQKKKAFGGMILPGVPIFLIL